MYVYLCIYIHTLAVMSQGVPAARDADTARPPERGGAGLNICVLYMYIYIYIDI